MNNSQTPIARREGLIIQEMPDEILVYDLETNKARYLNETAAFVWKACNGINSVADITQLLGNQSGKHVDENLVCLAIDQLNENDLLAENLQANFKGQSRRAVIRKIGLSAFIALPIVSSLVAPMAVSAQSGSDACDGTDNTSCVNAAGVPGRCCGGICCGGQAFPCNASMTCG